VKGPAGKGVNPRIREEGRELTCSVWGLGQKEEDYEDIKTARRVSHTGERKRGDKEYEEEQST